MTCTSKDKAPKFVIVVDSALPPGLAANAAAVLALTVGPHAHGALGPAVCDADGTEHPGITRLPIPVLACAGAGLGALREEAARLTGVFVAGFPVLAQRARRYDEYRSRMAATPGAGLEYAGVALYGEADAVARLTGYLPLLR